MHLDKYGLPVQANGDAKDQLQRAGMIATGVELSEKISFEVFKVWARCDEALTVPGLSLQPKRGVYIRHTKGNPNNVSADQLISVLAYWIATRNTLQARRMLLRCLMRLGFAQNYKDGLNADNKTKIPDFMLLRALPLFLRISKLTYPIALLTDLYLVLAAIASAFDRDPNSVDDNNLIITLAVCRARMPTPLSWLACKLYGKLRPWNYGCAREYRCGEGCCDYVEHDAYPPVYGALRWYHRAEAGGNPEIAELWKPICERYFE